MLTSFTDDHMNGQLVFPSVLLGISYLSFRYCIIFNLLKWKEDTKNALYILLLNQVCQLDFFLKVYESLSLYKTIDIKWIKNSNIRSWTINIPEEWVISLFVIMARDQTQTQTHNGQDRPIWLYKNLKLQRRPTRNPKNTFVA